jgi:hypothetical protein
MKWLINLFKVKKDEVHTGPSDFHNRIAEIQARIAAVRSRNGWDQAPDKNIKVRPEPLVAQEKLKVTKIGNEDLKAKLLSMKK